MIEHDFKYFTLVFKGDIRDLKDNPFKIQSPFGQVVASGYGNAFDEIDKLEAEIDSKTIGK